MQNRICKDLKEGLLESAILHGYDGAGQGGLVGFCLHLAERHPKVHGNLLAKLLPYNLTNVKAGPGITAVNIISVPHGCHLSQEQMERAHQGEAFTIDHDQRGPAPIEAPDDREIEPQTPEAPQMSEEEEVQLINKLQQEISDLAQQAGISLVQHQR